MIDTLPLLVKDIQFPMIRKGKVNTFQVNLGYLCNQQCNHCHVNASPTRTEIMSKEIIDKIIDVISKSKNITILDLTGGAPEMNPNFKYLVESLSARLDKIIVRSNLTILMEPGYEDYIEFFVKHGVEVTASLPCYSQENVDAQRGKGVFDDSIKALQALNKAGYASHSTNLVLNLVYNPGGAFLPPPQQQLEEEYKNILHEQFDIQFNNLYTITNMPIKRFGSTLVSKKEFDDYMTLLQDSYNKSSLDSVMCKNILSIGWDGNLYDCDFNQMLNMKVANDSQNNIKQLEQWQDAEQDIVIANHCFACTAGQGSSCGGALL
jgi:radical SAM/Cys-rich protein